ncbi:hypothetical protein Pcinc_017472 [Petrolisthes cinctipes]|uniref:Uncharacterized protein n=1 Tax=Petrolisthes cinctipes TaxID=88211 RepID=A0AAE1FRE3_PETCI|nr:hypothetical protein Pcinc_017472 [Petrolisthes cinctipes]
MLAIVQYILHTSWSPCPSHALNPYISSTPVPLPGGGAPWELAIKSQGERWSAPHSLPNTTPPPQHHTPSPTPHSLPNTSLPPQHHTPSSTTPSPRHHTPSPTPPSLPNTSLPPQHHTPSSTTPSPRHHTLSPAPHHLPPFLLKTDTQRETDAGSRRD